jgi:rSAM/selenodomain-associated transferase 1
MDLRRICALGVMAKAPRPGRAKTRLCPPLQPEQAAQLSAAFLRDITENIALAARAAPIHGWVAYAPAGEDRSFDGHLADGTRLVLADGSPPMPPEVTGFGRSLLHALQGLFRQGYGAVCLVNSDSPTLPTSLLVEAAQALLLPGERVVLGPADDGGYYLIGMNQPHAPLFADIAWSTASVAATTRVRANALNLDVLTLPTWYDVDDIASLARLQADAVEHPGAMRRYAAPATMAWLRRSHLIGQMSVAAQ